MNKKKQAAMKNILLTLVVIASVTMVSCWRTSKKDTPEKPAYELPIGDNSQVSLDWAGVYEGILPCADCTGIKTTILLNNDLTYIKKVEYLEGKENENIFVETGKFEWDRTGSSITLLSDNDLRQYKVGENQLFHLDNDGRVITGQLAAMYVLKKK